jgi:transposase-like protein
MNNNTVAVYLTLIIILAVYFIVYGALKGLISKLNDTHVDVAEDKSHRLNLCLKHKQEDNQSHYSDHNCHYCQLKIKLAQQQRIPGPE